MITTIAQSYLICTRLKQFGKKSKTGIDFVAFTCTEVSLAINGKDVLGIEGYESAFVVDTTELLAINAYNELALEYGKWKDALAFMKLDGGMPEDVSESLSAKEEYLQYYAYGE